MANFPTWINKNKSNLNNSSSLSPRQVANKALSLAVKKLDKDDKRRRPQYTVRERLLLSNTMIRAEDLLNKRTTRTNRRVMIGEDDDVLPPAKKMAIAPPPPVAAPVIAAAMAATPIEQKQVEKPVEAIVTPIPIVAQIKNESPMISITAEQRIAVSLAVVAAAAYSRLSLAEQQSLLSSSSHDFCRPIMIPTYSSMTSITTII
ncbi:unnamed protein product [Mucor hiemalis]